MLTKIWNWFVSVEHDVETILADFGHTVARLEDRAAKRVNDAMSHATEAMKHTNLEVAARMEADKAAVVAAKIKALIS